MTASKLLTCGPYLIMLKSSQEYTHIIGHKYLVMKLCVATLVPHRHSMLLLLLLV